MTVPLTSTALTDRVEIGIVDITTDVIGIGIAKLDVTIIEADATGIGTIADARIGEGEATGRIVEMADLTETGGPAVMAVYGPQTPSQETGKAASRKGTASLLLRY